MASELILRDFNPCIIYFAKIFYKGFKIDCEGIKGFY